ncbi:MAG: single-stranded DNA-binding protein [Pseudomonadota bacterium]|nr:single-stranded DNA-binding protein [Pseudomonadota bacterium]|tara:strand:+ start:165 stop:596 length:432 start_codon:yes stop_codon:yes gene_type:complete
MSSSLNESTIIGYLGADPEVKVFDDGSKVVNLSVATSDNWTDNNGVKQESTDWHRVVVRKKAAEFAANYLKKGSHVLIRGPIKTRKYTDSNGIERYVTEIIGLMVKGLNKSEQNNNTQNQQSMAAQQNDNSDWVVDDTIPFGN